MIGTVFHSVIPIITATKEGNLLNHIKNPDLKKEFDTFLIFIIPINTATKDGKLLNHKYSDFEKGFDTVFNSVISIYFASKE